MTDLFDTHAHLHFPDFADDLVAVLDRAREAGVAAMLTIGTDVETSRAAIALAARERDVWAAVGVHPHDAASADVEVLDEIERLAASPRVVAVGEIGLDYFRNLSPRDEQLRVFEHLLGVARRVEKPVIIHCREPGGGPAGARTNAPPGRASGVPTNDDAPVAHVDVLHLLRAARVGDVGGVMHCFSGDVGIARQCLDLGLHISIAGPVTYPSSRALPEVARFVPDDRIVVETDCPFLPPQTHRGKRNEPAYVAITAARVAELRGRPFDEMAARMSVNARALFRLDSSATRE
ncbi:MAG: hydrolase TatD [Candidatus Rokuibacteriota bacterium]|nr:MAG: hydrolase TatD [Candidatus Rokubacteria bacterium]